LNSQLYHLHNIIMYYRLYNFIFNITYVLDFSLVSLLGSTPGILYFDGNPLLLNLLSEHLKITNTSVLIHEYRLWLNLELINQIYLTTIIHNKFNKMINKNKNL